MTDDLTREDVFLNYVVGTMVTSLKFRKAFVNILEEVGLCLEHFIGNELKKEKYFSLVGIGKKIAATENKVKKLKSQLIDFQQAYLLLESPKSLCGLHNATTRILSRLVDAADGFHSFFGNPLDEFYGFHYLKQGWSNLEVFEAEYSIIREVLRDLLDPVTFKENFENIQNLSIL